jgi:hypothetical protein
VLNVVSFFEEKPQALNYKYLKRKYSGKYLDLRREVL